MSSDQKPIDWSLTTWEGSRREQLRQWRKLTVRERLQAVDEMHSLSRHFEEMHAQGKFSKSADRKKPFDYTEWQQTLWEDESVDTVNEKAKQYRARR